MPYNFRKKIILIISITFLLCGGAPAWAKKLFNSKAISQAELLNAADPDTRLRRDLFPTRERLVYRVKWMGIPAGEIIAEVQGLGKWRGRKAYRIEVWARTIGVCSVLYRIKDHYVSYIDAENFHTLRHEVHRREGSYEKDAVTDFDQVELKAYFKSLTDGSVKSYPIVQHTLDTVTAAYFARFFPLEKGKLFRLDVANSEKQYELFLGIQGKQKRVTFGDAREVYHFQPYARYEGEEVKAGRLSGYITADEERLPVLVVIKAPVFTSVTATLVKAERSFGKASELSALDGEQPLVDLAFSR